jgi:hypothetical protein
MAGIKNSFALGPEGWCSYEYHASIVAGENVFIQTTWSPNGGIGDGGYVWTDHTRWSADTPEKPLSILPLIRYQGWVGERAVDLRGAELGVSLRGDGLQLNGARCYFWAHIGGTRWHCSGRPIEIAEGRWPEEPTRFVLDSDEALWHHSWSKDPAHPASLDQVLSAAKSYGFSFVGFGSEVSGRLSLGFFELDLAETE